MRFPSMKTIFLIVFLVSPLFALEIIEPVSKDILPAEVIDLGIIGPGQTVYISINPEVQVGGKFGKGGRYDVASVTSLPQGWKSKESKLYGNPLQVEITADKLAGEGDYSATITVFDEDEGEELPDFSFSVKAKVSKDVMEFSVSPKIQNVGPGQPARYVITITNKGTASDVFEVSSVGIEKWRFKKYIYVPPKSTKTYVYEITESEEERYNPTIQIVSTSSNLIKGEEKVTFSVSSNIIAEYKATNHGTIIFPLFEMPIYALTGLISNLFTSGS